MSRMMHVKRGLMMIEKGNGRTKECRLDKVANVRTGCLKTNVVAYLGCVETRERENAE